MRLAPGWVPWVLAPLAGALLALPFSLPLAVGLAALAVPAAAFFRDPERRPGEGIVAAADGRLRALDPKAVTFLNLHDVHVVRAPFAGRVRSVERVPGPRLPAFLEGAEKNGGVSITVDTTWGACEVHLIAGFLARRAVAFVEEGDAVDKGERVGLIRFGSRVDVELPEGARAAVEPGRRVRAAETTIAHPPDEGAAPR